MKKIIWVLGWGLIFGGTQELWARGGDRVRSSAPVTALVLDARDGYAEPLKKAYFDDEIDFFLDMETPNNKVTRDLSQLREAGRMIYQNDYASAAQALQSVQGYDDEKAYLNAVMEAASGRYEKSLDGFRRLIDRRKDLSRRLMNLSFMGAARIFHEIGDYKQAIYHYNQVRQLEPEFFEAVFEKGWSFYLDGDMNGSLGATLTFLSPYFDTAFYPETMIVRAASFYQLCLFDRAAKTIERLRRDYQPIVAQMKELEKREPDTWLFDDRVLQKLNKKIVGALVADQRFRAALRAHLALKKEAASIPSSDRGLNSQALAFVRGRLINETRRVLQRAQKVTGDVLSQADLILVDILQSDANALMGVAPESSAKVNILDLGTIDFDEAIQFWPFKGEFWVDELGSYYYGLKSNCPEASKSALPKTVSIAKLLSARVKK